VTAFLTISQPPANTILTSTTVQVSGTGGGLPEANVVVRVKDGTNAILAEQATVLQGPDVGLGGEGTWTVQVTFAMPATSSGVIEAFSPGTGAYASVPVHFQISTGIDYPPGQCIVNVDGNTHGYDAPNGNDRGTFSAPGAFEANRREQVGSENWYRLPISVDELSAIWVRESQLVGKSPGCN
jgi:hypothetical protein